MARSITSHRVEWVALPTGAESPVAAYVNGAELLEGAGISVREGRVWFDEPLKVPHATTFGGKLMLTFGIGVYGDVKGDHLDLKFHRNGQAEWITDVRLIPTDPPAQ